DIYPKAPIHLLIIPKRHIDSLARLTPDDIPLVGGCMHVARVLGEKVGYGERGYRVSCNVGPEGGQVVYHLHFHLTAGRRGGFASAASGRSIPGARARWAGATLTPRPASS